MNIKKSQFCFCLLLATLCLEGKVRLVTFVYNRPEMIHFLHLSLQKNFISDTAYELLLFNDATDKTIRKQIEQECQKHSIKHILIPQEIHILPTDASCRHSCILDYACKNYLYNHNDAVGIIDDDLFLLKPLNIQKLLQNVEIASATQKYERSPAEIASATDKNVEKNIEWLWPGLIFFYPQKLPNIKTFSLERSYFYGISMEVGSRTYDYLRSNPSVKLKKIKGPRRVDSLINHTESQLRDIGLEQAYIDFIENYDYGEVEFFGNFEFFHYAHSAYGFYASLIGYKDSAEFHQKKGLHVFSFLNSVFKKANPIIEKKNEQENKEIYIKFNYHF